MSNTWSFDFTNRYIGYNLDPRNYISKDQNEPTQFYLEYDFGIPFKNILVEKYRLEVILPEGVTGLDYILPPELSDVRKTFDRYYSYLDFFGRPIIVFEKENVLDSHNEQKFVVQLVWFSLNKKGIVFF